MDHWSESGADRIRDIRGRDGPTRSPSTPKGISGSVAEWPKQGVDFVAVAVVVVGEAVADVAQVGPHPHRRWTAKFSSSHAMAST